MHTYARFLHAAAVDHMADRSTTHLDPPHET